MRDVLRIASGQPNLAAVLSEVFVKRPLVPAAEHPAGLTPEPLYAKRFIEKFAGADGRDWPSEVLQARSIDSTIREAARDKLRPMMKSPIDVAEVKDEWVVELLDRRDADPNDEPGSD